MKRELKDSHGRVLTYLRLSVTDRCNLRCFYCMPQSRFNWIPHDEVLSYEEIISLLKVLTSLGIKKVRLTGGEPLVRRDILALVQEIIAIPGLEKLCITTNGTLLPELADDLYRLGLRHLNISLDSLDSELFAKLSGKDQFHRVWQGIRRCIELGFHPLKLNAVMLKGRNESEIPKLAGLVLKYPVQMRFIEFMPIGKESPWNSSLFFSSDEARTLIEKELGPLVPSASHSRGPAEIFHVEGGLGSIGFINPMSHNFCSTCNRIRITSDGKMRLCLFSDSEIDLKSMLRAGAGENELADFILDAVQQKPEGYAKIENERPSCTRDMSSIGG